MLSKDEFTSLEPRRLPGDLAEVAVDQGMEAAYYFYRRWDGVQFYIPAQSTVEKLYRDPRILDEYDGLNEGALSERYGVSRRYVRDLVRRGHAGEGRSQGDFFEQG